MRGHLVIQRLLAFRRGGAIVNDPLLADHAPARLIRRVIFLGGIGMDHVARTKLRLERRVIRPIRVGCVFHRVQMVEPAPIFIKPLHCRQKPILVAQMILAELPGRVAKRLEHGGQRRIFGAQPDRVARQTNRVHPRAHRKLPGDKGRPTRGTARLCIVVGQPHTLGGKLVEIGRLDALDPLMIARQAGPAHIIGHDHQNIRWRLLGRNWPRPHRPDPDRRSQNRQRREPPFQMSHHSRDLLLRSVILRGNSRYAK